MKNNESTSFIIFAGILVLCVFTVVSYLNLFPNHSEGNSYYVKVDDDMNAKIEELVIESGQLKLTTSGDALEYCVKSTKSTPDSNSLCWKKVENDLATISIYPYKKYYVWIKDGKGNISSPISVNARD